jgi:hypothetical protein
VTTPLDDTLLRVGRRGEISVTLGIVVVVGRVAIGWFSFVVVVVVVVVVEVVVIGIVVVDVGVFGIVRTDSGLEVLVFEVSNVNGIKFVFVFVFVFDVFGRV